MSFISKDYLKAVVEIGAPYGKETKWRGSGILYGDIVGVHDPGPPLALKMVLYVVTNKHVLRGISEEDKATQVVMRFVKKSSGKAEVHNFLLASEEGPLWCSHPSIVVDVAVLRLRLEDEYASDTDFQPITFPYFSTLSQMESGGCMEGDSIFVVGFPYSVPQLRPLNKTYPIVRGGIISRIADAYAGESDTFIIDATVYPGNSGGPVILKSEHSGAHLTGTKGLEKSYMIGIVSEYLDYQENAVSEQTGRTRVFFSENSGLARVETTDNILATLNILKSKLGAAPD